MPTASAASRPTVWITGAGGLIGNYLVQTAPRFAPGWQVIPLTRAALDLTDFTAVRQAFAVQAPAAIIHAAAHSKSPFCQKNPTEAKLVNVNVTENLVKLAKNIPFFFFSSDMVFDGQKGNYEEADLPRPLSVYAETKVAAEQVILANPLHTVIRTSLNAGTSPTGDRAFNEEMALAWRAGKTLNLFVDEFRCPLPAAVTARAVWELLEKRLTGLFHLAGSERLSRWQIGELIAAQCPELSPKIEAGSLRDYQGAPRSPDTSLNCSKIQSVLSFPLPSFRTWRVGD